LVLMIVLEDISQKGHRHYIVLYKLYDA